MGPILAVVLAIAVYGLAESLLDSGEWSAPLVSPLGALGLVALPYALGALARASALAGRFGRARRLLLLTESSGWTSFGVAVLVFGWARFVDGEGLSSGLPDARLFAVFAPFFGYQVAAIHATVRAQGGTPRTRRHLFGFQLRMFVASVVPLAAFLGASALVAESDWLRVQIEHVGMAGAVFTVLFVSFVAWMFPTILGWAWDTAPFPDGPRREALDVIAERARFTPRAVRVWRTGDLLANATIIGIGARQRVVLFSDQLLAMLNVRELCAVYAHEIGHARRGHVGLFLAFSLGWVLLADVAVQALLDGPGLLWASAVGLVAVALWIALFGWVSRRAELDADLFALETCRDLPALVSALQRVGGDEPTRGGWRHFSVRRRIEFLARAAGDEEFVRRFKGQLVRYGRIAAALCVAGVALEFWMLARDLPRDRTVASLARGQFDRAARLADGLGDASPDVARMVALAATFDDASLAGVGAELEQRLRGAADLDEALAVARIAELRGADGAATAAASLADLVGGDRASALRRAGALGGALGEALRARIQIASESSEDAREARQE
ncbi:MAG: M48 family metalloprotease [Planctomycetota bacterium]